jgi:hypothetical protein
MMRAIMTEPEKKASLSYTFLALRSKLVYACFFNSSPHSKINTYLQGLVLNTKYDIVEVMYATRDAPPLLLQIR